MDHLQAQDKLIDLAYGELEPSERAEVEAHVAQCPPCRAELDQLLLARSLLARGQAGEPPAPAISLPQGRPARRRRAFWASLAAAAALLLAAVSLFHPDSQTPAVAEVGPIQVEQTKVSLTIISQPADWRGQDQGMPQQAALAVPFAPGRNNSSVQTWINAPAQTESGAAAWPGLAMVRDQRIVRNLPKGPARLDLTGVPAGIWPESVRLRSLDEPEGRLRIIEQNYQYDLANGQAVLQRCLGRKIVLECRPAPGEKAPRAVAGTLMSMNSPQVVPADAAGTLMSMNSPQIVLADAAGKLISVEMGQVRAIRVEALPPGLQVQPTLVWQVENAGRQRQQFEAQYLTWGLTWRADYILNLHPGQGPGPDTADLTGYATVTNNSGVTYPDAEMKLLAGDLHLVLPKEIVAWAESQTLGLFDASAVFVQRNLFEYHLYALQHRTTLANRETKQIEMLNAASVSLSRTYVYDPVAEKAGLCPDAEFIPRRLYGAADAAGGPRIVSELINSKGNGLGQPLPKGLVRLYAPDDEGAPQYAGKVWIDHTAENEKLLLTWGRAFDIACSFLPVEQKVSGDDYEETVEYRVHNAKPLDVTVTLVARVPPCTKSASVVSQSGAKMPWHKPAAGRIEIPLRVARGTRAVVRLTYVYNYECGGGLEAPGPAPAPEMNNQQPTTNN